MVIGIMRMVVVPTKRREFLDAIRGRLGPTRASHGCTGVELNQNTEDQNVLTLITTWRQLKDLDAYFTTRNFTELLVCMDMLAEKPNIDFHITSWTAGLEMAAVARGVALSLEEGRLELSGEDHAKR